MKLPISRMKVATIIVLLALLPLAVLDVKAQVMNFEEAIEALDQEEYNYWERGYSTTGEAEYTHFSEEQSISGFLMWIASNGTAYQVSYPSLEVLNEYRVYRETELWNDPAGYYVWVLEDATGWWYILANNGTIVAMNPQRNGPNPPPEFPTIIALASAVIIIAVIGILTYYKKYRKQV